MCSVVQSGKMMKAGNKGSTADSETLPFQVPIAPSNCIKLLLGLQVTRKSNLNSVQPCHKQLAV